MTHIYVRKVTIVDSDDGLSPGRCQSIISTNAGILLIGPFSEIRHWNEYIFVHGNAFENFVCETTAILSRPQFVKYFDI